MRSSSARAGGWASGPRAAVIDDRAAWRNRPRCGREVGRAGCGDGGGGGVAGVAALADGAGCAGVGA
eukprot:1632882-Pyramimonas_sp.AAC.1